MSGRRSGWRNAPPGCAKHRLPSAASRAGRSAAQASSDSYDWSSTRNGLVLRSHPIVVVPPCPGSTCVSSGSGRIFSAIDAISCS